MIDRFYGPRQPASERILSIDDTTYRLIGAITHKYYEKEQLLKSRDAPTHKGIAVFGSLACIWANNPDNQEWIATYDNDQSLHPAYTNNRRSIDCIPPQEWTGIPDEIIALRFLQLCVAFDGAIKAQQPNALAIFDYARILHAFTDLSDVKHVSDEVTHVEQMPLAA